MTFVEMVNKELARSRNKHNPIMTIHEGYAVLLEEVDEFWDEVKNRNPDYMAILEELIQVGAMAQRVAEDLDLVERFGPAKEKLDGFVYGREK